MHNKENLNLIQLLQRQVIAAINGTYTILVTPEIAAAWLKFNECNRVLRVSQINTLAKRMKRGKWKLNGECLIFSKTGRLLNGQHRLHAVIKNGEGVYFDVRFGIDDAAFSTIDDGHKRTAADVFSANKIQNYTNAASATKIIMGIEKGLTNRTGGSSRPSNEEVKDYYVGHPEIANFVSKGLNWYNQSGRLIKASKFAAYAYAMAKLDYEKAIEFMDKLSTGVDLGEGSIILKLRNRLMRAKFDKTQSMASSYEMALIAKSWRFFLRNKTVKVLAYDTKREKFPTFY